MSVVRPPAVAGYFYEGDAEALEASLRDCFTHPLGPGAEPEAALDGPGRIAAVVSPHAGFVYSGPAAAHGFAELAADGIPETAIILGPSHSESSREAAVSVVNAWRTPLGEVTVDADLGRRLAEVSPLIEVSEGPHRREHSLEVQVPFLQFIYGERTPSICPICVRSHVSADIDRLARDARDMGEAIALAAASRRVVVIASTDFSHQIPHDIAQRQDRLALDAILGMEPGDLLRTVHENAISMCGPVPTAIAMSFALARGAREAKLLSYYSSGDVIGDRSAVVGYASLVIRNAGGKTP